MRRWPLILLALTLVAIPALAQEIEGPEPGVFLYDHDSVTEEYTRTYYPTQQEAIQFLQPRLSAASAVAASLNVQTNNSINEDTTAAWMIFFEQWELWQGWVIQEYNLEDLGEVTFATVPGTPLRWEISSAPEGTDAAGVPALGATGNYGYPGEYGGQFEASYAGGYGASTMQQTAVAPTGPGATVTMASFLLGDETQQREAILSVGEWVTTQVTEQNQEHCEILTAILDEVEQSGLHREHRAAYVASRQRDITNLREIILNQQGAIEMEIGGTLYLFSDQPLSRTPDGAVNITTPNLTPFDILRDDGTLHTGP